MGYACKLFTSRFLHVSFVTADCAAPLHWARCLLGIQERAGVYSRHTAKGNTRQTPKQYLGGSLEVYELLLELKKDDQDINPAAVAAVGKLFVPWLVSFVHQPCVLAG